MLDDLKVTRYDDDLEVVLDAAFASNGEDGQGVLPGGLTGQILKKLSNADYDTLWDNPSAGVPNDGTAGQILSKVSSDPYDTIWINPPDPVTGLYLPLTGGTLTGELSVPSIVVPGDTASITLGGSDGFVGIYYDNGYLSLTNSTWGGSLQLYSPGTVPGAVNSQICTLAADPSGFAFFASAMGSATQPHFWIQNWDFGTTSVNNLTTYADNAYDIGIATPITDHGRPRSLYVGTGIVAGSPTGGNQGVGTVNATTLWENGVSLVAKYAALSHTHTLSQITDAATKANVTYVDTQDALKANLAGANTFGGHNTFNRVTVNGGPLTVDRTGAASAADVVIAADTLQSAYVNFYTGASPRWRIGRGSTAEGGSGTTSTGSDFNLQAYDNAGTSLGNVFHVLRGLRTLVFDAPVNFATVTAPASPNNGDVWFDGTALKIRISGATKTVTVT